jgi:hypothetical protein
MQANVERERRTGTARREPALGLVCPSRRTCYAYGLPAENCDKDTGAVLSREAYGACFVAGVQ